MAAIGTEGAGVARAAVIGAGSMGGGIAAQFANAGIPVDLLDVPGAADRDGPARAGIARQLANGGFMAPEAASLVRPGNVEDHGARLAEADWVVEAVVERLPAKTELFARIAPHLKESAILSSNTSTISRAALAAGLPADLARRFVISHFFNPPRAMRLVEIVPAADASPAFVARLHDAAATLLGKTAIACRDTPGFVANRIGCFWMAVAALEARRLGLDVETADAVQAALGVPRTGVFGLFDLVGIDLVPQVWGSLLRSLPPADALHRFDVAGDDLFRALVAQGRFGRKAGAGFYRRAPDGSPEALDLKTLHYRPRRQDVSLPGRDPAAILADPGLAGGYARSVLSEVLAYASAHAPEIADDVGAIDTAMELGYSWRQGPFALAERVGLDRLVPLIAAPPALLSRGVREGFYRAGRALAVGSGYAPRPAADPVSERPVIAEWPGAVLHDLGDGVACFRIRTKMNAFAPDVLDALQDTLERAGRDVRALVLGNDDPRAFSAGADLGFFLRMMDAPGGADALDAYVARGQDLFLRMRRAPVPVVAAIHGFALGGGCEFQMHADAAVAHAEANIGLPETGVGLVPGWGGCTRLLARAQDRVSGADPLAAARVAFDTLFGGEVSTSAARARTLGLLRPTDGMVMSRDHLIDAAKACVLALLPGYAAPAPQRLRVSGAAGAAALLDGPRADRDAGRITDTDLHLAETLVTVLTGDGATEPVLEDDIMRLERRALTDLAGRRSSRERIAHMLATGKRLKN